MEFDNTNQDVLRELHEHSLLADVGETCAVYMHELGNALNNVLLDLRLLQRELPDEHQDRLAESCNMIVTTAKQMQQVAQYRQGCRTKPYPIDFCVLVQELVSEHEAWLGRVTVTVPEVPVLVVSTTSNLKRVVRLLIDNLVKPFTPGTRLDVRFETSADSVILRCLSPSSNMDSEELQTLFEAFPLRDTPCSSLEMAVCKNLARKMNGSVQAEPSDPQGIQLTLTLPLDPSTRKDRTP